MQSQILALFVLATSSSVAFAHYSGPFLFWGIESLNDMKIPTLQAIDDANLRDLYTKASAIVIFIRNATTKLSYENFPELSDIIGKDEWLYLPQETLTSDPLEYNVNAEVFTLTGPVVMQDNEIAAFYRDAQINYGNRNVLGILAARNDNNEHVVVKRQARAVTTTTDMPDASSTPQPDEPVENLIYVAANKAILYTSVVPVLNITGEKGETVSHKLQKHAIVTADERNGEQRLIVKFVITDRTIVVKFVFQPSAGNWRMNQVELEDPGNSRPLTIVGRPPSAPIGNYSFVCGDTFLYQNGSISLTLKNIQVQPFLNTTTMFGKPMDCVGVTSPAILAGVFVTTLLLIVLSIALTAILDIKTPNRFESRSSKQLTFTVQE